MKYNSKLKWSMVHQLDVLLSKMKTLAPGSVIPVGLEVPEDELDLKYINDVVLSSIQHLENTDLFLDGYSHGKNHGAEILILSICVRPTTAHKELKRIADNTAKMVRMQEVTLTIGQPNVPSRK